MVLKIVSLLRKLYLRIRESRQWEPRKKVALPIKYKLVSMSGRSESYHLRDGLWILYEIEGNLPLVILRVFKYEGNPLQTRWDAYDVVNLNPEYLEKLRGLPYLDRLTKLSQEVGAVRSDTANTMTEIKNELLKIIEPHK